jgi:hypothetical protein
MSHSPKFLIILAFSGAIIIGFVFLLHDGGAIDGIWRFIKPELFRENLNLTEENERLKQKITGLERQNSRLASYLDVYEQDLADLRAAAENCDQIKSMLPVDLPTELTTERFEIRQLYRELSAEKQRWDRYQQAKYEGILEDTIEPRPVDSQSLDLEHEENREYFRGLEKGLALHRTLIRDVRLFHDEIQFQKAQRDSRQGYELFDLKFQLPPFARESALADALQQAMSALSAGIYQEEAVEVLDRVGAELTRPIRHLNEHVYADTGSDDTTAYNYDLYTVYGKKLMEYSDSLSRQSAVTLAPSAFGELDFFNREMFNSLYDLYEIGQEATIDPERLDLDELERVINSNS